MVLEGLRRWLTKAPGRRRFWQGLALSVAAAIVGAATLAVAPVAHAAPGDEGVVYFCGPGFGFCGASLADTLPVDNQLTLNFALNGVPGYQRPIIVQALGSLGPVGAGYYLNLHSQSPEALQREFAYLADLLQNFPPEYQRAYITEYFQHQLVQ